MPRDPTERFLANALGLRRYSNGLATQVSRILDKHFSRAVAELVQLDPTEVTAGYRARRIAALDKRIKRIMKEAYAEIHALTGTELIDLAAVQEAFAAAQLDSAISGATVTVKARTLGRMAWRSILAEDPVQGLVMKEWWTQQSRRAALMFRQQVQLGMSQSEDIGQIVRRTRGRSLGGGRYAGGVLGTIKGNGQALVRTAVNQISNRAALAVYEANKDITKTYRYTATLDTRTTMLCISYDGEIFKYGLGPVPPLHWACRSTIVPVIDYAGLGIKGPAVPGKRAVGRGLGTPVPATTNYGAWLRGQPAGIQDKVLGPGRAKLFRSGKVGVRDLIRSDGSTISLVELRAAVA